MTSALLLALTTGCSASFSVEMGSGDGRSPAEAAVSLIESRMAEDGLPLEASCEDPPSEDVGVRFACEGRTGDGRVVNYSVLIQDDGEFLATPSNLLGREMVEGIEALIGRRLSEDPDNAGLDVGADNVDCGDGPVILDSNDQLLCVLTDPVTSERSDLRITAVPQELGSSEFDIHVKVEGRSEPVS